MKTRAIDLGQSCPAKHDEGFLKVGRRLPPRPCSRISASGWRGAFRWA